MHLLDGTHVAIEARLTRADADRLRDELTDAIERTKVLRAEAAAFRVDVPVSFKPTSPPVSC